MPEDFGRRYLVDRLLVGEAFHGKVLDITEEGEVLEETGPKVGYRVVFFLEMAVANRKFSSV